ncbi:MULTISPECIES: hypothetical protein [unclassified Haloarcula]|uniref:hypothetical protein n=1 Tax=unclassified Haloarcula TaxID=2624677 RepID=UPI00177EA2EA|nr:MULTISPECIES: hypothetical protein [unclassified Haloarcula]
MSHARSILLAGLLVLSAVVTGVGPALAQTSTDTYAQEFTTGPHKVEIDLSNVTTETTISVITSGSPAGDNVTIMKKTVSASTPSAHFRNAGAYDTFTVQVEGADAEPGFSKGGVTDAWKPGDPGKFLGDTGGDADFTYDLSESVGESVMPSVVQLDRTGLPGSTAVNTTGLSTEQTHIDLYQSGQNSQAQADNYHNTMDNYLSDTKTQARIIGKNAYIRALNNGSSKSAAKSEAKSAVADYYATKQENLAAEWTQQATNAEYIANTMESESGLNAPPKSSKSYTADIGTSGVGGGGQYDDMYVVWDPSGDSQETLSLVNGSTATYQSLYLKSENLAGDTGGTHTVGPDTGIVAHVGDGSDPPQYYADGIRITAPNSNYESIKVIDFERYSAQWSEIQTQNTQVQNDMDTLANNTYSAYQKGEINNSDLVDPYVLSNQQSAGEDFQGWAAAQLTLMGTNSPENFDQIGSFNVTTGDGTQYEGVLFSQENPASGQFENGTTYNTSNIGGTQYVVTSDRIVELDGEFTIDSISTQDGQAVQNVTIQKTTYETTNVTELKQQYEDLARKRAEIEAREQNLRGSAGGGLLGGSSSSLVLVLVGVGTLYAVSQRRTGGNN